MVEWLNANGQPYDPGPAIAAWRDGDVAAGQELSDRLYHQGTVNSASYAAVSGIVDLISTAVSPRFENLRIAGFYRRGATCRVKPCSAARFGDAVSRRMGEGSVKGAC